MLFSIYGGSDRRNRKHNGNTGLVKNGLQDISDNYEHFNFVCYFHDQNTFIPKAENYTRNEFSDLKLARKHVL